MCLFPDREYEFSFSRVTTPDRLCGPANIPEIVTVSFLGGTVEVNHSPLSVNVKNDRGVEKTA
jgi:hypothetical protein